MMKGNGYKAVLNSNIPQLLYAKKFVNKSFGNASTQSFPVEILHKATLKKYIIPQNEIFKKEGLIENVQKPLNKEVEKHILFGAGPAKLPKDVIRKVQSDLMNFSGTNQSILEISHRSPEYMTLNNDTIQKVKDLLNVPDNYKVLFMQGGGTGMFASIPMNLITKTGKADYIITGSWSAKAAKEATKYGQINHVFPKLDKYGKIPDQSTWNLDQDAAYVYYCANETVDGVEFQDIPDTNGIPLVADMSSNICSRTLDVSKFGVIFAGAQKNIGPSGVTLVIIREDLMGNALKFTPAVFDYATIAKDNSLYNTPPSIAVYIMGLVFDWIIENGGVEEMEQRAIKKSTLLYDTIQNSKGFYINNVEKDCRSRMNVVFRVNNDEALESDFVKEAKSKGLLGLKGHRSIGGIRASIYNAIEIEHTQRLVDFMKKFQDKHQ